MRRIPRRAYLATFVRSFAIQGSWNYRTMLGQGFAFALLPVLRHVYGEDRAELERALERHAGHFNAHPYLAGLALGAVARMEVDGADPEEIRRFKAAVRGPLGGLGDRLVWVGALPAAALAGLVVVLAGAPVWLPPLLFVATYNAVHLAVRAWAFRAGLQEGPRVAGRLRGAELMRYARWLATLATFLVGGLGGLAAVRVALDGNGVAGGLALAAGAAVVVVGARRGQDAWRWAMKLAVAVVAAGLLVGIAS